MVVIVSHRFRLLDDEEIDTNSLFEWLNHIILSLLCPENVEGDSGIRKLVIIGKEESERG
jgi:hypothetical protein